MKLLGLLMLVLACTGWGILRTIGLGRRIAALEAARRLALMLEQQIRYTAAPTAELLQSVAGAGELRQLPFLQSIAASATARSDIRTLWKQQLNSDSGRGNLTREDALLLIDLGETLGLTDVEGQVTCCRYTAKRLEQRLVEVRADTAARQKLYPTLGAAGGMAVALLLL